MMKAEMARAQVLKNDVDSGVSFEDDADEEIDTTVIEEKEDWIEYIKRSTEEATEEVESAKIRCWNKTQKMKWKLALRIASSPSDRWLRKAADWNPPGTERKI